MCDSNHIWFLAYTFRKSCVKSRKCFNPLSIVLLLLNDSLMEQQ